MKNKSSFIKPIALFLAVISMVLSFSACEHKPEPPEENAFSLVMDFAQTTVRVGDKVTYRALLKNTEDESYTLNHSGYLISISVVEKEKYTEKIPSSSIIAYSEVAAHGQFEQFYEFAPTEKGEYILKAYCAFTIEGKETTKEYFYECDEITITVV